MRNIRIIAGKEVRTYLASPMAYVVTAVFLALSGVFFTTYLAATGYADTRIKGFLDSGQVLILLFAAVMTMRLVAEEKKLGTWELLMTAPVREGEIVLGKFLGTLAVLAGMLVLTLWFPLLLVVLGDPDLGPIATSYLGLLLLGCAALAVGVFASALSANQIVAAVVAGGILFALWFLATAARFVPGIPGEVMAYLSLATHFPDFARGVIDTRALVYFASVTALFLYLATRLVEAGRWQ